MKNIKFKHSLIVLFIIFTGLSISACGKKDAVESSSAIVENSSGVTPISPETRCPEICDKTRSVCAYEAQIRQCPIPKIKSEVDADAAVKLTFANPAIAFETYKQMDGDFDLGALYYFILGIPLDVEKETEQQLSSVVDQFKKKDARAVLEAKYNSDIASMNENSRYRIFYTNFMYGPYSDKTGGFSLLNPGDDLTFFNDENKSSRYPYMLTNTKAVQTIKVTNEAVARVIESQRASSQMKLKFYVYFQGANASANQLKAQITRLDFLGENEEVLLSVTPVN